ncbi:MAG TPA: glycosyltransferase family 4 protein [Candidatus Hydrogenedentes bacterium]|nr:glycosyltransferase family 4 protein [Candidatus Hydrogenedentota bacterium]HPG65917.1 glycosyltransferase family 4 protein [Candidatus Hydrogenedentota bacterium]
MTTGPRKYRLAFVDLMFSWPPHGGADVDLYETLAGLARLGHEVRLFYPGYEASYERGCADPAGLPFSAEPIPFTWRTFTPRTTAPRFREAIDAWRPDAVFLYHGYFLKPFIAEALRHYPTVGRYYAYELVCPRDALLFRDGAPCTNNYLKTPDACRRCALPQFRERLIHWRMVAWTQEYVAGRAFLPSYHARLLESVRHFSAVIVSNPLMASHLEGITDAVHIFPGGVDLARFAYAEPPAKPRAIILAAGRLEDPLKGLDVLRRAGAILAEGRHDFEIWATHGDYQLSNDWFKTVGWRDPAGVVELIEQSDICVVPSIWEEPFGLAAVEAMAAGRPVCASRVGGLQTIVRHGETGFLFERENAEELARYLAELLDDSGRRRALGAAGRRIVETKYDWNRVIEGHWPPFLERLLS